VQPKDGYFTAHDGVKIHYLEAGNKNGPGAPVVLINGYTRTALGNWFTNGIADALVGRHWVVAIDCRGHGKSDKPHDPAKYGPQMARDVIELMDHLGIKKAHIGGYSMGGGITSQLLATNPDRFVTAIFGGSGVPEVAQEWKDKVPADKPGPDPKEAEASKKLRGSPDRDDEALAAVRQYPRKAGERSTLDLTKIKFPVLAINGEFDRPNAKTHRMQRELVNFKSVVLPGKSHLTAIMPGYIPKEYIETMAAFIDANDRQQ
jgi:pimeloyl-ACP methyl ester carboxylesterase